MSRPGAAGSAPAGQAPGPLDLGPGRGVGDRPAAGQQRGHRAGVQRAALAGPPRDPADRGAGARGQRGDRGVQAGHLGGALADQDHRPRRRSASTTSASRQVGQHRGLGAGHRRDQVVLAASAAAPVSEVRHRRGASTGRGGTPAGRCLRAALRSRRKTIGASSSGSSATHSTAGAASRPGSSAGAPGPCPTTCAARKSSSSAECGRARKSTSLVRSGDPGELRVGVGVLDGQPAAGQHPDARRSRAASSPSAATCSASVQDVSASSPSRVRAPAAG